jgi:excisionase family DNA binding protein
MAEYDFAQLLTVRECAHALRCSESTVRRAVRAGRIHAFRLADGGQLKIPFFAVQGIIAPELVRTLETAVGATSDDQEPAPPVGAEW